MRDNIGGTRSITEGPPTEVQFGTISAVIVLQILVGLIVGPEVTPFVSSAGRGYLSLEWTKMSFRFLALLWPTTTLLLLTKAKNVSLF